MANGEQKPKFDPNGELTQEARRKIQAQFGHAKDQDAKLFVGFLQFFLTSRHSHFSSAVR
jgi:hypothetical protein